MGLDMFLTGDKYVPKYQDKLPKSLGQQLGEKVDGYPVESLRLTMISRGDWAREKVDGYPVESLRLTMGYWRGDWALHNYIMDNHGDDDGRKIGLGPIALRDIADAVEQDEIPDGFTSEAEDPYKEPERVAATVKIFRDAADWLDNLDNTALSVEYYGSW